MRDSNLQVNQSFASGATAEKRKIAALKDPSLRTTLILPRHQNERAPLALPSQQLVGPLPVDRAGGLTEENTSLAFR